MCPKNGWLLLESVNDFNEFMFASVVKGITVDCDSSNMQFIGPSDTKVSSGPTNHCLILFNHLHVTYEMNIHMIFFTSLRFVILILSNKISYFSLGSAMTLT